MISNKKALDSAKTLMEFCNEQDGCQNCIFRKYYGSEWKCHINFIGYDLKWAMSDIESNIASMVRERIENRRKGNE